MANHRRNGGAKPKVLRMDATCLSAGPSPAGGFRATLAMDLEIELPDGQRFRSSGSRTMLRVYPIPPRSPGVKKKPKPAAKKTKAGAARRKSSARKA